MDEITLRADVAKGTFYNYFLDKGALEIELVAYLRGRLEEEIALANEGIDDPARRIARALCCVLRLALDKPGQVIAMMRLLPHASDPAAPLNSGARRDVDAGLARGRLAAPSAEAAIACIIGVCMAGANRALDLSAEREREFGQELGVILLHGLGLGRSQAAHIMRDSVAAILS